MKKILTTLHRWLGFPVGLLFVITFGTGCLTALDELLERREQHLFNTNYTYRATTVEEDAKAISTIIQGKQSIRQLQLPSPATPYYQVFGRGEHWVYPIDELDNEKHITTTNEGVFRTLLQLHRNFLLGREGLWGIEGSHYAAWVGLIALFLSLLGLWLWWPLRKTFTAKDVVPRGRKRKHFYYSHMTSGIVVLLVIILLSLTGASITYRAITQQLLGIESDKAPSIEASTLDKHWLAWLSAAYAHMPKHSQLEKIRFPRQPQANPGTSGPTNAANNPIENLLENTGQTNAPQILEFQFQTQGDWLGLAGSKVKIDKPSAQLVDVILFADLPFAGKLYSILVPLHTGHHLPTIYGLALLVFSLLGTAMVFSGLVSFVVKKRKTSKNVATFLSKATTLRRSYE